MARAVRRALQGMTGEAPKIARHGGVLSRLSRIEPGSCGSELCFVDSLPTSDESATKCQPDR